MADTRERLIELLAEFCPYKEKRCVGCDPGKHYHPECKTEQFGKVADHLIANGVTMVVHGWWIEHEWAEEENGLLVSNYECSVCHSWERDEGYFCPNCGAKMDGEKDG